MKISKNEQGAAAIAVIGAVLIVGVIIAVGGYVYSQNMNEVTSTTSNTTNNSSEEPSDTDQSSTETSKTGTFKGIGTKTGSGSVTLSKKADGTYTVNLGSDFEVQQGPDLFVSFADNDAYAEGTAFAELKSLTGAQEYTVPSNINPEDYTQVMIWCREFNAPFTVGTLQ